MGQPDFARVAIFCSFSNMNSDGQPRGLEARDSEAEAALVWLRAYARAWFPSPT